MILYFYLDMSIPSDHGEKLHDIPDEYLVDTLLVAKKIASAIGCPDYNILQVSFVHTSISTGTMDPSHDDGLVSSPSPEQWFDCASGASRWRFVCVLG